MRERFSSFLKFAIGWPLALVAFFFIARIIAPQADTLYGSLGNLNYSLLMYGVVFFLLFYALRSYIWHRLLKNEGYTIPFRETCYLWAIAELKRYVPGKVWTFLGRTVAFSEKGVKKKDIAASLVVEIELFVVGAVIASCLALPFLSKYGIITIPPNIQELIYIAVFALTTLYIANPKILKRLPERLNFLQKYAFPKYRFAENLLLVGISTVALIFFGLGNYFTLASLLAVHPQLVWELTGFFSLAIFAGFLSFITPAGFGVREGIVIAGLSKLTTVANAAFLALFLRLMLIIVEVLFIALAFLLFVSGKTTRSFLQWIANHKHETILFFFIGSYIQYFTVITFLRYDHFYTGRFDLGNMAQTVWNTLNGRIFLMTNPNATEPISRLAFHADFILILLTPFYALWQNPKTLLLIQTVVLAFGAYFVYRIGCEVIKNKNLALVFGFAYLINPAIQRTNIYDFHPVTLATTFLLAAFYVLLKKRYGYFVLFAVLAALCKEQVWLIIALFGAYIFIFHKKRLFGLSVFAVSLSMTYYLITHAIPQALGGHHFALEYYAEFGEGPLDVAKAVIFSPHKVIELLMEEGRVIYMRQLLLPVGYLPVLAPLFLIFAGPDLGINLLSSNVQLHQIYYQYSATITPFIFIAAIYAASFILKYAKTVPVSVLMLYLIIMSLYGAFRYGPLPGAKSPNLDMIIRPVPNVTLVNQYLDNLDKSYKVTASNNAASHLSHREHIYVTPLGMDKADVIVFLLTDRDRSTTVKKEDEIIERLLQDPDFRLDIQSGDFYVFKRQGLR